MRPSGRRRAGHPLLAGGLFVALALLSGAALVVTQRLRQGEDIVNTVRIERLPPSVQGPIARVSFRLAEGDARGSVQIVRGARERLTAVLLAPSPMPARDYELTWDGRDRSGAPAREGFYRARVVLGEQDREIVVPGGIRVGSTAPADAP